MADIGAHKHLVRLVACCTHTDTPYLMAEYITHGNLKQLLRHTQAKVQVC